VADVSASDIEAYVTDVINSDALKVSDVASVAAQAALEISGVALPPNTPNGKEFVASLSAYRQRLIKDYLSKVLRDYAVEFAGVDAGIALNEIADRNEGI